MSFVYMVFLILIPFGLLKFIMNYNHLLVSLFILEFLSLSFFFGFCLSLQVFNLSSFFMLYFLVMSVCEGVLGLCLLVLMSLNYSSDLLFLYNKLMC